LLLTYSPPVLGLEFSSIHCTRIVMLGLTSKYNHITRSGRRILALRTLCQQQKPTQKKLTEDSRTRGPVSFFGLGLMVITAAGILGFYNIEKEKKTKTLAKNVKTTGKAALGGPWVLVDQDGIPRTDASYRGKFTLLYFGFTFCPDICPSELVKVGNIMKALDKQTGSNKVDLVPLFISVDPSRDTLGQIRHYRQDFHPSMVYLTGTKDQVAKAARSYRVYFSKANENENDEEDYLVDHSIVLYLVSPDGEFLDFFTQRTDVKDVVKRIQEHAKNYK